MKCFWCNQCDVVRFPRSFLRSIVPPYFPFVDFCVSCGDNEVCVSLTTTYRHYYDGILDSASCARITKGAEYRGLCCTKYLWSSKIFAALGTCGLVSTRKLKTMIFLIFQHLRTWTNQITWLDSYLAGISVCVRGR